MKNRVSWTSTGAARSSQGRKHKKYRETAAQQHAELLPFCVGTCGGMAPDAITLLAVMGQMGDERLGVWPHHVVIRHLLGAVATSMQRGSAVGGAVGIQQSAGGDIGREGGRVERMWSGARGGWTRRSAGERTGA